MRRGCCLRIVGETPPQAWGRRKPAYIGNACTGNTPTGVGKTVIAATTIAVNEKHPHRRGEDDLTETLQNLISETPPQAWGRPGKRHADVLADRNTPTGVGKTTRIQQQRHRSEKHPHRRGEDSMPSDTLPSVTETPPQAWGRQVVCTRQLH